MPWPERRAGMKSLKSAIRQTLRAERRALAPGAVQAAGDAVVAQLSAFAPYQGADSLLAYVSADNEVPTAGLIADAQRRGVRVYLPRIAAQEFLRFEPGEPLVAGPFGILEPCRGSRFKGGAAVAFVPVVAWDPRGVRLGRGGGWYDRVLARLGPGLVRAGLGYEFQRREELPRDAWDVLLDFVITERRVVQCTGAPPLSERRIA